MLRLNLTFCPIWEKEISSSRSKLFLDNFVIEIHLTTMFFFWFVQDILLHLSICIVYFIAFSSFVACIKVGEIKTFVHFLQLTILTLFNKDQSLSIPLILINFTSFYLLFHIAHLTHKHFNSIPVSWVSFELCIRWILLYTKLKKKKSCETGFRNLALVKLYNFEAKFLHWHHPFISWY